ncbi:acylglycerol kinase family protein [Actinoplanes bogorensis]|uniref:Acylglycerol kinase family protein n=1 Tax=Paractinoplanes bogorensis TaxID=1610840 RepID=A0ABS5Z563_9ACTN|nr:acylglycerol kinase family protein [Actinoplanes bogorensis]MBU2670084.1 acylglycerol kinase family protein [Actinoplanes bogorensis]
MYDVVVLSLAEGQGSGGGCGDECGGCAPATACAPRVPVLKCADALTAAGARVEMITAASDQEIDEVIARFDGPARPDGLTWPDADSKLRLVVATSTDGQLRAVVRRLVRRYAPPPSKRPDDLAVGRTVPDLPPLAILPLDASNSTDLAFQLRLPRTPEAVAAAVLSGPVRRLDLLRNDGGSVTVDGALVGGMDDDGRAVPWRGRVEVDDAVLSDGDDPILACAIGNGAGYAEFAGLRMLADGDALDGQVEVAVAVPTIVKQRFRGTKMRVEVRRARGRAVSVLPRDGEIQFLDDGVGGAMNRKRSWWTEAGAWAVYAS